MTLQLSQAADKLQSLACSVQLKLSTTDRVIELAESVRPQARGRASVMRRDAWLFILAKNLQGEHMATFWE